MHLVIAGGRQGSQRAAMKGFFVDHDLGGVDAAVVTVLARDLDRRLVGFQPRIAEKHVGHARDLHQPGGQLVLPRHGEQILSLITTLRAREGI